MDIKFIQESYNIDIEINTLTIKEKREYKGSEIIRIFEEERGTDHELSDILYEAEELYN